MRNIIDDTYFSSHVNNPRNQRVRLLNLNRFWHCFQTVWTELGGLTSKLHDIITKSEEIKNCTFKKIAILKGRHNLKVTSSAIFNKKKTVDQERIKCGIWIVSNFRSTTLLRKSSQQTKWVMSSFPKRTVFSPLLKALWYCVILETTRLWLFGTPVSWVLQELSFAAQSQLPLKSQKVQNHFTYYIRNSELR